MRSLRGHKKELELEQRVQKYAELHKIYNSWKSKDSKGYDTGGCDRELESTKYWLAKLIKDNLELLI